MDGTTPGLNQGGTPGRFLQADCGLGQLLCIAGVKMDLAPLGVQAELYLFMTPGNAQGPRLFA